MFKQPVQRRSVLQGLAAVPFIMLLPKIALATGDNAKLDPNDPLAKAMKYVEDASKADKSARTDKTAICGTCAKYAKCPAGTTGCQQGKKTDAYAACETFSGKHVNRKGWCMSWTKA